MEWAPLGVGAGGPTQRLLRILQRVLALRLKSQSPGHHTPPLSQDGPDQGADSPPGSPSGQEKAEAEVKASSECSCMEPAC